LVEETGYLASANEDRPAKKGRKKRTKQRVKGEADAEQNFHIMNSKTCREIKVILFSKIF